LIALVIAAVMAFSSYWKSDKIALAVSRAQPADEQEYRRLHNLVEGLCIAGGLPKPKVYIIHDDAPNAFATGRNPKNAAIAVTTGLLQTMNRVELEGVVAHELSHIKNYDILVSTLAVTLVGTIAIITDLTLRMMWWNGGRVARSGDRNDRNNPLALIGLVLLILAPILAKVMQASVSRRRETLADVSAVRMTRYPPGLISALEKLQADNTVTHSASMATAHLWIEQPMSGVKDAGRLGMWHKLFNTHPPLAELIALLREM
jgi:heat shock protein HtpX